MTTPDRAESLVDAAHGRALLDRHARVRSALGATWTDGTPLGNGRVGAVVWASGDDIVLTIDHAEFWDRRSEFDSSTEHPFGAFIDALEHRPSNWPSSWPVHGAKFGVVTPTRLPPSRVVLSGVGAATGSRHDLAEAALHIRTTRSSITVRVLGEHDAIVVDGIGDVPRVELQWAADPAAWQGRPGGQPPMGPTPAALFADHEPTRRTTTPDGERLGHAIPDGSAAGAAWCRTGDEHGWSIRVGLVHRRHGDADSVAAAAEDLVAAVSDDPEGALDAHRRRWQSFHARSWISVPTDSVEALWFAEMAKLGSAVRSDGPPLGLQGPWSPDGRMPPWGGDLHHNVNVQLSYAPMAATNHAELTESLVRYVETALPEWRQLAERLFAADGVFVPSATDDEGRCRYEWAMVNLAFSSGPWLAHVLHTHWRHTGDSALLDALLRPFLHGLAEPLLAQLVADEHGVLHLPHSYSPEMIARDGRAWGPDGAADLALLRWLLDALVEVDELIGADTTRWRDVSARLTALPTDADTGVIGGVLTGRSGGLRVRSDVALDRSHRHHSHLLAIHPLRLMTASDPDPAVRNTVSASCRNLVLSGPGEWVGFSTAWAASIAAHSGAPDIALGHLRDYAERWVGPSTFHLQTSHRGEVPTIWNELAGFVGADALSLEAGFAFAAAVTELLVQDHGNVVRVFPALPRAWSSASFAGLRAAGGWELAARADGGHTVALRVLAHHGGDLVLHYPTSAGANVSHHTLAPGESLTFCEPGWSIDDIQPMSVE